MKISKNCPTTLSKEIWIKISTSKETKGKFKTYASVLSKISVQHFLYVKLELKS